MRTISVQDAAPELGFTHWQSQGMNLALVRARIGAKVAGQAGIEYVAVSGVKHPRHLVFDTDLPP